MLSLHRGNEFSCTAVQAFHPMARLPAASVAEAQAGSAWLLWRGGLDRRGARLDKGDPVTGGVNWRFFVDKYTAFYASPAVVGNRVYCGGGWG